MPEVRTEQDLGFCRIQDELGKLIEFWREPRAQLLAEIDIPPRWRLPPRCNDGKCRRESSLRIDRSKHPLEITWRWSIATGVVVNEESVIAIFNEMDSGDYVVRIDDRLRVQIPEVLGLEVLCRANLQNPRAACSASGIHRREVDATGAESACEPRGLTKPGYARHPSCESPEPNSVICVRDALSEYDVHALLSQLGGPLRSFPRAPWVG